MKHCRDTASAYINNSAAGVSIYCFACGFKEFEQHGRLSAADYLAMRRVEEETRNQPTPTCVGLRGGSVPSAALLWFLKSGISPERAEDKYHAGWSERLSRVVLPILHNGERSGSWIARAVDGRRPKYIMSTGASGEAWYDLRHAGPVVFVEDTLSAIRVSEAGYSSLAVLGTSISVAQSGLVGDRDTIGWFDGDAAGDKAWVALRRSQSVYGSNVRRVSTPKDPKLYGSDEIRNFIKEAA